MGTLFSDTLTRLRKTAGFPTAYRFYHDNGGAPVLQLSYRKYLLMEQGRILPVIGRLQKIFFALRLPPRTPSANELVLAWLRTMAGEEAFRELIEPALGAKTEAAGLSPLHKALERSLADKKSHVTPDQFRVILSSLETYKCSLTLENDTGAWSAADLAKALGIKKPAAEKSLGALAKAGLLKEMRKGLYKSRLAGTMVEYPNLDIIDPALRGKLRGYLKEIEDSGATEWASKGVIRADALALRGLFPLINMNVAAAQTYAVTEKTDKTAFFYIIGKVVRLWDF